MNDIHRDYQRLKMLDDFSTLEEPIEVDVPDPNDCPYESQMILRMLVRPKYGSFKIPPELAWLEHIIFYLSGLDHSITGIKDSWCYVTVRHGPVKSKTDDEWHFDGASFRTDIIPERNYIWVDHHPIQYRLGNLNFPDDFDPTIHNLFSFADKNLSDDNNVLTAKAKQWYLINPFCLHRRDPDCPTDQSRTFVRISFPDIEGRDVNNTPNPLLPTPAFGRDPVSSFRNKLLDY